MSTYAADFRTVQAPQIARLPTAPFQGWLLKSVLLGTALSDMSFLEHLEELRTRILRALIAVGVGTTVCALYAVQLVNMLLKPALDRGIELVAIDATEMFSIYVRVAMAAGICVSAPLVLWEVWRFIEPALYRHEKRYAVPFILSTSICFIAGAYLGFAVAPGFIEVQAELAKLTNVKYLPSASSYLYLLTAMLVSMGLIFQMPPVVFVLSRIGLVNARFLLRNFQYAFLIFTVAAALLTPGGDIAPMFLFSAVMSGIYGISILVAAVFGRSRVVA